MDKRLQKLLALLVVVTGVVAGLATTRSFAAAPDALPIHECTGGPMGPTARRIAERLKTIPPALSVRPRLNWPRRGDVLFTVTDSTTGKALANTTCEIWRVRTRTPVLLGLDPPALSAQGDPFAEFEIPADPITRVICKTDEQGMVRIPFGPHFSEAPTWSSFLFPIARGYELEQGPQPTITAISRAWRRAHRGGIELKLRRQCSLTLNVKNGAGAPIAEANLIALPLPQLSGGIETRIYSGAGYAAARAGRRLDRQAIAPALRALDPINIRQSVGAEAQKPSQLHYIGDDRIPSLLALPPAFLASANEKGVARFAALPTGDYAIFAMVKGYDLLAQEISIVDSDVVLELSLDLTPASRLQVVIAWYGDKEKLSQSRYQVSVLPCGYHGLVDGPLEGAAMQWQLDPAGEASAVFTVEHLPVGSWTLFVALTDADNVSQVDEMGEPASSWLRFDQAKSARDLEVAVGPKSRGWWTPTLVCDGQTLSRAQWFYRRIGEPDWTSKQCPENPSSGQELPFDLEPGHYEALVGNLAPVAFTIEIGATTKTRFEIPVRTIQFTVADDLRKLMDSLLEDDRPVPVTLCIAPEGSPQQLAGFGCIAQPCLRETFYRVLSDPADCETQLPVDGIKMKLPSGIYHWSLASTMFLEGVIDLRGRANTAVEFGLKNLPGIALGQLSLDGIKDGDKWTVEFADFSQKVAGLGVISSGDRLWFEADLAPSVIPVDRGKYLLFAPPGWHDIRILCGDCEYWRSVWVPGVERIIVPDEDDGEIVFKNAKSADDIVGYAAGANGLLIPLLADTSGGWVAQHLPCGDYALTLVRRRGDRAGNYEFRPTIASILLTVGASTVLDFAGLKFEPFGRLAIKATGRCPATDGVDWWWLGWWFEGGGQGTCQVEVADSPRGFASNYRAIYLGLSQATTRPVPCLDTRRTFLPPGEYNIRPYPGAPQSAWRKVIVEAGKDVVVSLTGK